MLFLSVGRNHPKKNYAGLLDATARLLADSNTQKAPFQLAIVGKYAGDLAGQVDALNLSKHVKLIDQIGDAHDGAGVPELPSRALVDLYLAADIFVFPSLIETFGIAIVEAMAAGLPVIVGDSPGCRDVVRKGRDGTLVDPREPDAIATVMSDFMTDGAKRASHAAKAKSRAQDFDWDRVVDQYIELYDRDIIAK
jgi:phosphatidylinositol alpha-mannosyltransferase